MRGYRAYVKFTPANSLSLVLFIAIVLAVAAAVVAGIYSAKAREPQFRKSRTLLLGVLGIVAWNSLFVVLSGSGFLARHPDRGMPLFFLCMITGAIAFGLSGTGRSLAVNVPLQALVLFQGFRLPLELVLHWWSREGTIPETMTWTGQNFDILTGIMAIAFFPFAVRFKWMAWMVNIVGFVLLVNVLRVTVLSSPLPFGWPVEPKMQLILHFPYLLIGPTCIAGALAGHVILTRALTIGSGEVNRPQFRKP
jgi:uncharacterized protein YhhL (DUF1145 family)